MVYFVSQTGAASDTKAAFDSLRSKVERGPAGFAPSQDPQTPLFCGSAKDKDIPLRLRRTTSGQQGLCDVAVDIDVRCGGPRSEAESGRRVILVSIN
jgi:hypothetical protein